MLLHGRKDLPMIRTVALALFVVLLLAAQAPATPPPPELARALAATCRVEVSDGVGTGWVVRRDDSGTHVITCAHVVKGTDTATLTFRGHIPNTGVVEAVDVEHDTAMIRLSYTHDIPSLEVGTQPDVGDEVFAVGCPAGIPGLAAWGRVSASAPMALGGDVPMLVLDFPSFPGYSGSAICRRDTGDVVGMLAAGVKASHLTFAVTSDDLRSFLEAHP